MTSENIKDVVIFKLHFGQPEIESLVVPLQFLIALGD